MQRWKRSAVGLALVCAACVEDRVFPDLTVEPECGNGVVESGEHCDVDGPGCVRCLVVPGWACTPRGCTQQCGDGVVGTGAACDAPRRETECDLSGYWAARETDFTRDAVIGALQSSSTWYLYHLQQSGDDFHVVEQLECGIHVTGTVTVDGTTGTLRALTHLNRMDLSSPAGARHGTSRKVAGGCEVTLDRWYKIRGADPALLPPDFSKKPALGDLPPLPSVEDPVTATDWPKTAVDSDGDGLPGVSFRLSGFVNGVRNAAQRDWKEFASLPGVPVPSFALVFTIPGAFDLQEKVLRVTECGRACPLIAVPASPARDVSGRLTLAFIGKTYGGVRVGAVVAGPPREHLETDLTTCARVRLVLPHDSSPK